MRETQDLAALREGKGGGEIQGHALPGMERQLTDLGSVRGGEEAVAAARSPEERVSLAERYAAQVVRSRELDALRRQRRRARLLPLRLAGIPLMLVLLGVVLCFLVHLIP